MTKSEEWKEFKRIKEDVLSEYTDTDKAAIVRKWKNECLEPLGYNHEFKFIRCDKMPEEEKAKHCTEWAQMFKDGKFSPDKAKPKGKKKPKRGASLDDLSLDDNPEDASPDVEVNEPSKVDKIMDQVCKEMPDRIELDGAGMTKEEKETEDYEVTKFPKAPVTIEKQKPKPKPKEEKTMATTQTKSKKELLLEAINALEEEENTGLTEEQVKKICVSVFCDLFKEVIDSMQSRSMALLTQIKKDEEE